MITKKTSEKSKNVSVTFSLPASHEVLTVLPSARLRPTVWRFGDREVDDLLPFEIDLADT